jgi:hypothetical protein
MIAIFFSLIVILKKTTVQNFESYNPCLLFRLFLDRFGMPPLFITAQNSRSHVWVWQNPVHNYARFSTPLFSGALFQAPAQSLSSSSFFLPFLSGWL